jgi:flagellar basal body-associated protein FliL
MNYFTKTRILITIIVVLAITLLATIGTMVYSYYKQKQVTERFSNNPVNKWTDWLNI